MDFLKIDAAHLLGLSMGGVVCFEFYKNYPERVKSLVLANTLHKLPEEAKPLFEERLKLLERGSMEEIAEFIANISFHQKRRELIDLVKTIIRKNDKEYYTKVTIEIGKINYEDLLPKIAVPTLVIVAEFDITTPPELGEQIAKLIPNSTLKVVKNAAHLAKMENPEEFNRFVLEFLEGLER